MSVSQTLSSGTEIAGISVDGVVTKLYAPSSAGAHTHAATDVTPGALNIRSGFTGTPGAYSTNEGFTSDGTRGATGDYAHAEGSGTRATGTASHAEGYTSTASAEYSHAEGYRSTASGARSHAEGNSNTAGAVASHAEGSMNTATGYAAHAEGMYCNASGDHSHAEGYHTEASGDDQHVSGHYNIEDTNDAYAEIIGNGTNSTASNARTLDWSGNEWIAGALTAAGGIVLGNATVLTLGTGLSVANGVLSVDTSALDDLSGVSF